MQPKPTDAETNEVKGFMAEVYRDVLGQLTDPSKLADQMVSHVGDLGWVALGYMCKKIGSAAKEKSNRTLSLVAARLSKLRDLFDPSTPGQPKGRPIGVIAERLECSEEDATKILKTSPFREVSPGTWELEDHAEITLDKDILNNLTFTWLDQGH